MYIFVDVDEPTQVAVQGYPIMCTGGHCTQGQKAWGPIPTQSCADVFGKVVIPCCLLSTQQKWVPGLAKNATL